MSLEVSKHSLTQGVGNTKPPPIRCRSWVFTWNNPDNTANTVILGLGGEGFQYCFQHEVGEQGTPHIQGCVRWKNAKTFNQVKDLLPKCHIEKCKNWEKSVEYCSKSDTRTSDPVSNCLPKRIKDYFIESEKADWMAEIEGIIANEPHQRKIYWYWESVGNRGKTTFARHLCLTITSALYVSGKARDIQFAIASAKEKPTLILFDVPRDAVGYVDYQALEAVKNGIFFSGKYESSMVIYDIPHVICFANTTPKMMNLSMDRWEIKEI